MLPILLQFALAIAQPGPGQYFTIKVIDEQTGRGVPLVELKTVNDIRYVTDSNGIIAFHEPGLMDQDVFFHVSSHGYEYPKDGFGFRGKALKIVPGGSATLKIKRNNIAERLYRVTGGGIYRDSWLLGLQTPLKEPLLNARVVGQDSVVTAEYRGKLYWFWGDTSRPSYPLGNFHVPGAISELPGKGGLDPAVGVNLHYFLDAKGFAKETAHMPGEGPTWLTAAIALPDARGVSRLCGSYLKIKPPMTAYARGFAVFNDDKSEFEKRAEVAMTAAAFPSGPAVQHVENGVTFIYFAHPFPLTRVRATAEDFLRSDQYECYTPLTSGSRLNDPRLDRDENGSLRYEWRTNTPAIGPAEEAKLIAKGLINAGEARWRFQDRASGKVVVPHAGSVNWNEYRKKWIMVFVEVGGTSFLGEVWYAEADALTGPWKDAVKFVTHDKYSFYNPSQHPQFDQDQGRVIYLEGTYSQTFSGNANPTPRYDYNQIMYRLDLSDPRLPAKEK